MWDDAEEVEEDDDDDVDDIDDEDDDDDNVDWSSFSVARKYTPKGRVVDDFDLLLDGRSTSSVVSVFSSSVFAVSSEELDVLSEII